MSTSCSGELTKAGRRKRKTAIFTHTPEKQALENEQREKKKIKKNTNHRKGCKRLSFKRKTQGTKVKKPKKNIRLILSGVCRAIFE